MRLERLDIRGFKTFANATLELSSLPPGLIFVRGRNLSEPELESNGSGKSSLFAALFWALFGKTVDGLRNPDVKPWALKDKTLVSVRLDGSTVSRSVNPNRVTINGNDAGPEQIEKLLGISYDLASHTILMGQGRPLFLDLAPAQKMKLLSEALDLERWEERSRKAAERVSELEGHLGSLERKKSAQEVLADELEGFLEDVRAEAEAWDAQEQVDLDAVRRAIDSKVENLGRFQDSYAKADLAYDGAQTELRTMATQVRELHRKKSSAAIAADKHERLSREIQALTQTKTCPTCGQPVSPKNLDQHRAELQAQLETLPLVDLAELQEQLDTLIHNEDTFQEKSNRAMDARTQAQSEVAKLEAQIAELKKVLGKKQAEANPFQSQITDLKKRRAEVLKGLKALEGELEELQKKLEQTKFWIKGFREVRLLILEEVLQELELMVNSSLEELGLIGWQMNFEIERETKSGTTQRGLNVWIKSPTNTEPVRWECWSGGESQRLKIVGAAALNDVLLAQVGASSNVEIWDESGSFLSEGGVEDFIEFLANRAEDQGKIIFMVDHLARQSARFASTLTVTKKGGISSLQA